MAVGERARYSFASSRPRKTLPAAILIAGPQAFLREYVVDAIARRLIREGLQYRTFQIANASDFASVVEEFARPISSRPSGCWYAA